MLKIKPGIMVALSVRSHGGISYRTLGREATVEERMERARWETERITEDKTEYDRAQLVRSAARNKISAVCAHTAFGLVCPTERENELDQAISDARLLIDEHNADSEHTSLSVHVLKGRVASSDAEAAASIAYEVRSLLDELSRACDLCDPVRIRETAKRAVEMSKVLEDDGAALVSDAIASARKLARDIVRRVEKNGEEIAVVVQEANLQPIEVARFYLDDNEGNAIAPLPTTDAQRFAIDDSEDIDTDPVPSQARTLDME